MSISAATLTSLAPTQPSSTTFAQSTVTKLSTKGNCATRSGRERSSCYLKSDFRDPRNDR
eukprot:scaffold15911_cov31-Tisochrysis_lutea.AAC.1